MSSVLVSRRPIGLPAAISKLVLKEVTDNREQRYDLTLFPEKAAWPNYKQLWKLFYRLGNILQICHEQAKKKKKKKGKKLYKVFGMFHSRWRHWSLQSSISQFTPGGASIDFLFHFFRPLHWMNQTNTTTKC